MTQNLDTDIYDDDDEQQLSPGDLRKQLADEKVRNQELAAERDEARAEAEKANLSVAFQEAGIPADATWFRKHYKGSADPEAIKAEAVEAKVLEPPPPDTPQGELDAHDEIEGAAAGGGMSTPIGDEEEYRQALLATGGNPQKIAEVQRKFGKGVVND